MVKYFCDMCGEEIAEENKDTEFDISISFGDVKITKFVCPKCKKQICEQFGVKAEDEALLEAEREMEQQKRQGQQIKPITERVLQMAYVGYSQHDCESWHKCPKCGKAYGSWEFFHRGLKGGDVFSCRCGAKLQVPH